MVVDGNVSVSFLHLGWVHWVHNVLGYGKHVGAEASGGETRHQALSPSKSAAACCQHRLAWGQAVNWLRACFSAAVEHELSSLEGAGAAAAAPAELLLLHSVLGCCSSELGA